MPRRLRVAFNEDFMTNGRHDGCEVDDSERLNKSPSNASGVVALYIGNFGSVHERHDVLLG